MTKKRILQWFSDVKTLASERKAMDALNDPNRVFNLDETCFILKDKSPKVIAVKGTKHVYEVSYLIAN